MNVEIGTEAAHIPERKYINGIFISVGHIVFVLKQPSSLQIAHGMVPMLSLVVP
jgi:hypothetical protein